MKNKAIICITAVVILIAAVVAIIVFNDKLAGGKVQTYTSMEEVLGEAAFNIDYPDRLCGVPVTGFKANSSMIEAQYGGDTNYIRKTLGVSDNSDNNNQYNESRRQNINSKKVTLKGNDGLIFMAVWNDNNFAYTISSAEGVDIDEMTEYIEATR